MDTSKYYTPDITDVRVGYDCEHTSCSGAFDIDNTDDIIKDKLTVDDVRRYLRYYNTDGLENYIRTKYLDKSDIEECGWHWDADKGYGQKFYKEIDGKYLILYTEWGDTNISIVEYKKGLEPVAYITMFDGQCPSINELKIIQKLLRIN